MSMKLRVRDENGMRWSVIGPIIISITIVMIGTIFGFLRAADATLSTQIQSTITTLQKHDRELGELTTNLQYIREGIDELKEQRR